MMRPTEALQERLFQEMRARIKETDLSVPERIDGWLYYHRTAAGAQYPIYCRRPADDERRRGGHARPEPARRAATTISGSARWEVSPDHRLLAYTVDTSGAEAFTLYVKELATGALLAETIGQRLAQPGVGQRQPHPVLRRAGRGAPALPAATATVLGANPPKTRWCTSRPTSPSSSTSAAPAAARS